MTRRQPDFPRLVSPNENERDWPKMPRGWLVELRPGTVVGPYGSRELALVASARLTGPLADKPLGSK